MYYVNYCIFNNIYLNVGLNEKLENILPAWVKRVPISTLNNYKTN